MHGGLDSPGPFKADICMKTTNCTACRTAPAARKDIVPITEHLTDSADCSFFWKMRRFRREKLTLFDSLYYDRLGLPSLSHI